jgi:hypothetical protein
LAPFRKSKTVETPESIELAASALVTVGALRASAVYLLTTSEE